MGNEDEEAAQPPHGDRLDGILPVKMEYQHPRVGSGHEGDRVPPSSGSCGLLGRFVEIG